VLCLYRAIFKVSKINQYAPFTSNLHVFRKRRKQKLHLPFISLCCCSSSSSSSSFHGHYH